MQVACLGGVAEDFAPAWLFLIRLCFDGSKNLLELSDDFFIVDRLVEETADGVFGLAKKISTTIKTYDRSVTYLINLPSLRQPPRRLAQERTESQNDHREQDLTRDREPPLQRAVGI